MRRRIGRPSPAMAVAIAALAVSLVGTAIAAPTAIKSVLNKQEKKQTKAIAKNQADQQITQRASGLSVASANTAGLANSVAANAIGSSQVADNGLNAVDISTVTGSANLNFGNIATGDCLTLLVDTGVDVENDVVSVSPDSQDAFSAIGNLIVYGSDSTDAQNIRVNACNVGAALDPPSVNFRYIIFRR